MGLYADFSRGSKGAGELDIVANALDLQLCVLKGERVSLYLYL